MSRLTTNNPEDNLETALNFYYVKNHETWVRGGGDAPDYPDVSLFDWIKKIINQFCPDSFDMRSDEKLSCDLADTLMEGTEIIEGVIAHLYMSAWTHAELREKLMKYETAEEDSRLVVLPCKVGDFVYKIICQRDNFDDRPYRIVTEVRFRLGMIDDIGKTIFLTREEAEKALTEMEEKCK